jgi:hypothetical protein
MHFGVLKRNCHQRTFEFHTLLSRSKEIKYPLQWWGKYEAMFPIVDFLACQIVVIIDSQIEVIERFKKKEPYSQT